MLLLLLSCQVMSNSLRLRGLQHTRFPCPSPSPRVWSDSCSLSPWCHPTISYSVTLLSFCPQSFPASGSFPMTWLFMLVPKYWSLSFSISPSNEYSWLISLRINWFDLFAVQGFSRVFSNTTIQKHQFFGTQSSFHSPTLTSVHDYWKNHSFDYMDLCQQSDVSAF